jgi:flagellar assembly factor FliW
MARLWRSTSDRREVVSAPPSETEHPSTGGASQVAIGTEPTDGEAARVVEFPRGLLGFEGCTRFTLVTRADWQPFARLQSLDDPGLAFVVADPRVFVPDYRVEVDPREIGELDVSDVRQVAVWALVTVADDPVQISINLQGPLLINRENNSGKQLVLVHSAYPSRHPVLDEPCAPGMVGRRVKAVA